MYICDVHSGRNKISAFFNRYQHPNLPKDEKNPDKIIIIIIIGVFSKINLVFKLLINVSERQNTYTLRSPKVQ